MTPITAPKLIIQFGGWILMRLATDPDPTDEPRGVSGRQVRVRRIVVRRRVDDGHLIRNTRSDDRPLLGRRPGLDR